MSKEKLLNLVKDKSSRIKIFVALGLVGMLLIMLSEITPNTKKVGDNDESKQFSQEYQTNLENQLENIIKKIDGAGHCDIMITFETSSENVYAYNSSKEKDNEKEKNSYEYITVDTGDGEKTVLIKQLEPKISGVVVVCDGGDNLQVKEKIISCITALFNISTNRVSVNKMAQ